MYKKLITACMALSAFAAFAIAPSSAFAVNDPLLVFQENTSKVATGSAVVGTNVGDLVMTSEGIAVVTCKTATFSGTLNTNSGTGSGTGSVEGTIETANVTGHQAESKCSSTFGGNTSITTNVGNGTPWCVRSNTSMTTDQFQVRGGKCSEEARAITFVLDTTNLGACAYSRSTALTGTAKTHPEAAVLTVVNQAFTKESGSIFCPSTGELDMSFSLSSGGKALSILNQ